ncbi:hypothetical protein [Urbifossiella limnaea]|uniref:Uncharacterized protein n=1 Tax=Urbifossiella limnaea TaxID=2528023 RepID=A0A517XQ62_9BACT|nr:hypothetical protein [Urbifossiella limnaea]QDU19641.1 hypothetical protein ETAA1_15710 [Urbifossiella limnaea]
MFATLVVAAGLSPAQPPAPLSERWLLQLAPADLPRPPNNLYSQTWFDSYRPRALGGAWERWVQFRPGYLGGPATVSITKLNEVDRVVPGKEPGPVHRSLPLAVHGPLVEFDRKLYTAVSRPFRVGKTPGVTQQLHLGAAVELKDHVWYQAGTRTDADGKTVTVEEWKLEFNDNPRKADAGTVTVRSHRRPLAQRDGEALKLEVRFTAEAANEATRVRIVRLHAPDGAKVSPLPYLQLGNGQGDPDIIWTGGWDRLSFTPASRPGPVRLEPDTPGLVQPPVK